MATTHRSELVDAVTNVLMDEAYDGSMGPMSEVEFPRHVRRLAETALEAITESQREGGAPERVQLSRKRGWRKPENTVVVARPSRWGNPYRVTLATTASEAVQMYRSLIERWSADRVEPHIRHDGLGIWDRDIEKTIRRELAGKNLACWCPLDQPCHADVLLEIANGGADV